MIVYFIPRNVYIIVYFIPRGIPLDTVLYLVVEPCILLLLLLLLQSVIRGFQQRRLSILLAEVTIEVVLVCRITRN